MAEEFAKYIGADVNFTLTTQTGVSKKDAKPSDPQPKMKLTAEEQEIYDGKKGPLLQKLMKSVVVYGEMFGADKLVDLTGPVHMALAWGSKGVIPLLEIFEQLVDAGLKTYKPFTADPKVMDYEHNLPGPDKRKLFEETYSEQERLEGLLLKLGLIDSDSFSCSTYLPEVGNAPKKGDYMAWTESSAINYTNSAIGSRTNRNSIGLDMMCNILGKAPYFGLMTDEGRKAKWLIDVRTTKKPVGMLLGSAIGLKVMEDVPYIAGIEGFLNELNEEQRTSYLKDMGATTASNGAVGLYHIEGITPEAKDQGRDLLVENYQTYVIDDAELERVYDSYPDLWPDHNKGPKQVFIGCPHLTVDQLRYSAERIEQGLKDAGLSKTALPVSLFAGKKVTDAFVKRYPKESKFFDDIGAKIVHGCPPMYLTGPGMKDELTITSSNKCRVYSLARFFFDESLLEIILTGKLPQGYLKEQSQNE